MLYLQLFLFSSDHDTTFSLDFIICLIMVLFGFFFQLYWLTHQRVLIIIYCRWVYIFLPRNKIIIISIGIWLFNRRHRNNNIICFKCPSWRFLFVCQIQKWIILSTTWICIFNYLSTHKSFICSLNILMVKIMCNNETFHCKY